MWSISEVGKRSGQFWNWQKKWPPFRCTGRFNPVRCAKQPPSTLVEDPPPPSPPLLARWRGSEERVKEFHAIGTAAPATPHMRRTTQSPSFIPMQRKRPLFSARPAVQKSINDYLNTVGLLDLPFFLSKSCIYRPFTRLVHRIYSESYIFCL